MNKHFEDAQYYLGRAAEHAKAGMQEELAPLEERVRTLAGKETEDEPEPTRLEKIQTELRDIEQRAEGESKKAVKKAREQLEKYRTAAQSE